MKQNSLFSEKLEQVHDNLLSLARLLERANVTPRPQIAKDWVDGQEVMNALHISQRTLQNLRDNLSLIHISGPRDPKTSRMPSSA